MSADTDQLLLMRMDTAEDLHRANLDISRQLLAEMKGLSESFGIHLEYLKKENLDIRNIIVEMKYKDQELQERIERIEIGCAMRHGTNHRAPAPPNISSVSNQNFNNQINSWMQANIGRMVIWGITVLGTILATRWFTHIANSTVETINRIQ